MTQTTQHNSPLRQRMIEDMSLRKLAPGTQSSYIRVIERLAGYLGHSPDTATPEELRQFQLHLVNQGASGITLNSTITALKFLFQTTLERGLKGSVTFANNYHLSPPLFCKYPGALCFTADAPKRHRQSH